MNISETNFIAYKNTILNEVVYSNYYLSPKDAYEHIDLFTPYLKTFYENNTSISVVLSWIMSYDSTFR